MYCKKRKHFSEVMYIMKIFSFLLEDLKSVILTIHDNQYIHQLWITSLSDLCIQTEAKPQ